MYIFWDSFYLQKCSYENKTMCTFSQLIIGQVKLFRYIDIYESGERFYDKFIDISLNHFITGVYTHDAVVDSCPNFLSWCLHIWELACKEWHAIISIKVGSPELVFNQYIHVHVTQVDIYANITKSYYVHVPSWANVSQYDVMSIIVYICAHTGILK